MKAVAVKEGGLTTEQVQYFRKSLPVEIMLSNAVSKGVTAYLSRIDLAKVHKGKVPSLKELLAVQDLTISVMRWMKGERRVVAVMAHEEIKRQMRDLYADYVSNAKGKDVEYIACLPLLSPDSNPAKAVLGEAAKSLHEAFSPAAKPIRVAPEWVGADESTLTFAATEQPKR